MAIHNAKAFVSYEIRNPRLAHILLVLLVPLEAWAAGQP